MKRHRRVPLIIGIALATLLAACGGDGGNAGDAGGEAAGYNQADIDFLQAMIPHHEQAIEMAEMVEERTDRPELNELAGNVIESQTAEIDEIESMLEDAGEEAMDMADHGAMGMSQEELDELESLRGAKFDKMFSEMMIRHHEEAITMSRDVLDSGQSPDVADLAQGIIDEQQAEIQDLQTWLEEWNL